MKIQVIPDRTSRGNREYLENHLSEIQPIKKITCYQNSENFIFSEYTILTEGVFMVIESQKETIWLCTGLNCGYYGEGPRATAYVLRLLQVPEAKIKLIYEYSGFVVDFDEKGNYQSIEFKEGFFSPFYNPKVEEVFHCQLGAHCSVNPVNRKVYMENPQLNQPAAFFRCLEWMNPIEMEFTTQFGTSLSALTCSEVFGIQASNIPCNLLIRGKRFMLYGFIRYDELLSVVQSIALYCNKKAIYNNVFWNQDGYHMESRSKNKVKALFQLFKRIVLPSPPIHKIVSLELDGDAR